MSMALDRRVTQIQEFVAANGIYLDNTQPGHNKFWNATVVGTKVFCEWGRIGTGGQSKWFEFDTPAEAHGYAARKADEKTQNGYVVRRLR